MTSTRLRRTIAGSALVAAPLFKLASVLLWPTQGDAAVELRSAAAHPSAWIAASFLWLAFVACIGAGTLGLAHLVRRGRGTWLVQGAAAVVLLSMLGWGAAGALGLQEISLADEPNRTAMLSLYQDMRHSNALFVYVLLVMSGELALVALFAGLRRARLVPLWQPLAMVAAIGFDVAGDTRLLGVVESAFLIAAFWTVGLRVLRLSDVEWEVGVPGAAGSRGAETRVATAVVAGAVALLLSSSALAASTARTFSVVARSYTSKKVGKGEVFKEHLYVGAKRVGHDVVACQPSGKKMVCHGTITLADGTIRVLVSPGDGPDTTGSVVGGSGAYAGARGTVTLHGLPNSRDRLTFRLR
jgi:hypothetical protein